MKASTIPTGREPGEINEGDVASYDPDVSPDPGEWLVLMDHFYKLAIGQTADSVLNEAYQIALSQLTVERWRRFYDDEPRSTQVVEPKSG